MKSILRLLLLIELMCSFAAKAEQTLITTTFQMLDVDKGFITFDYAYFSPSLDVFDFASKIESTFRPEEARSGYLSIAYKISPNILVSYQSEQASAVTSRDREPFRLESDVEGETLLLQWQAGELLGHSAHVYAGYTKREQDLLSIDCYQYGSFTVGDCESADFAFTNLETGETDPALSTSATENRWLVGVSFSKLLARDWTIQHSFRYQSSEVAASVQSSFLSITDPFLLSFRINGERLDTLIDRLRSSFPQETPWKENVVRYDLGVNWALGDRWLINNTLGYLKVSRSGYAAEAGAKAYNSNLMFSSSVWYTPTPSVTVYVRGEVTKNYLLGLDSMLFNQRTAKFFDYPFAQVSAGLLFSF
jgi:hypothetical protein